MVNSNLANTVDLVSMFGAVAKAMAANQTTLNEADTYNHDHGDHMVQIFNTITKAVSEKSTASAASQLSNASQALSKNTNSGSAKLYSEGLKEAASKFSGKSSLTANDAMQLVQTLLGSTGANQTSSTSSASTGADLIGSLLGGLSGESTKTGDDSQIDMEDILTAGMAFLQAKQSGKSTLDAALSALVTDSKVADQDYRAQSATLVANTLVNVVSQFAKARS